MKINYLSLPCFGLFILFSGCTSDPILDPEPNNDFRYPMEVGNRWVYSQVYSQADTAAGSMWSVIERGIDTCEVTGTDLFGSVELIRLEQRFTGDDRHIGTDWYSNREDGLYTHAYQSAGGYYGNPAPGQKRYVIGGKSFLKPQDATRWLMGDAINSSDEIYYENPPKRTYVYPPVTGFKWLFRDNDPITMNKTYVSQEIVSTSVGEFNCWVIKWEWDFNGDSIPDSDIQGYDWIAREGLIKRLFSGESTTGDGNNYPIEHFRWKHIYTLTSYRIDGVNH